VAKDPLAMTWKDLETGCMISEPGSAAAYKTGDWRAQRPLWEFTRCIKCGACYIFCPDAAVLQNAEGFFEANLYHCKGCGICAHECPTGAIRMVGEEV
jgi:pyruvate ferredoxin oxidoreductase delta subunit